MILNSYSLSKKPPRTRWYWVVFLLGIISPDLFAQLEVVPYSFNASEHTPQSTSAAKGARIKALSLPFFDDFSTSTTQPDSTLWQRGSGVYVNNTMTTSQPSVNVATLDGFNAQGMPYNFVSELAQGSTDTLISRPIDLQGLQPSDSVYMSFFTKARGFGELPDLSDTLRLEFLTRNGTWQTVWARSGGEVDSVFLQDFVAIVDPAYFHEQFQFRFRAFGRLSGAFDTWHLDYVYINKNRNRNDRFINDIAARRPLSSLLARYTAMPIKQYLRNAANETATEIETDFFNLKNDIDFVTYTFSIENIATGEVLQQLRGEPELVIPRQVVAKKLPIRPLPLTRDSARLRIKFDLITTDNENPSIPTVDLRRNDSLRAATDLTDYYAYDDGSAEAAVRMTRRLGRVAVRYVLNEPDTLAGVRMALVPSRRNVTGQLFTVQVYDSKDGKPSQILHQQSMAVRYPDARNGFIELPFNQGVTVKDTFYIGWLQINEEPFAVGFDKNSTYGRDHIFVNLLQAWEADTELQGSIMIRPYTGGVDNGLVTSTRPSQEGRPYIYPTPTSGLVQWSGISVVRYQVLSLQGVVVRDERLAEGVQFADVSALPDGLYLMRLTTDQGEVLNQKLLIRH
jgi:hypothetical protein